jgi:glycosyltransferase involved in cell wall biosynthesis
VSAFVSAIIPVYDGAAYLAEAIASVRAQGHDELELIVVDDGSSDDSAAIARDAGAHVVSQSNQGIGAARNAGFAVARGDLIAFLDADDLWTPGRLALQLATLERHPELSIVSGHVEQFHSPELPPEVRQRIHCPAHALPGYSFGAMLIRRAAFERVGPVSTTLHKAECVDWCMRARDLAVPTAMLAEVMLRRRLHQTNHGLVHKHAVSDYAHAIKASLDRRRGR